MKLCCIVNPCWRCENCSWRLCRRCFNELKNLGEDHIKMNIYAAHGGDSSACDMPALEWDLSALANRLK